MYPLQMGRQSSIHIREDALSLQSEGSNPLSRVEPRNNSSLEEELFFFYVIGNCDSVKHSKNVARRSTFLCFSDI